MLTRKSYTFASPLDDGTQKAGALVHGTAARKEALALSFGRGLTPQMTRSTLSGAEFGIAGSYGTNSCAERSQSGLL